MKKLGLNRDMIKLNGGLSAFLIFFTGIMLSYAPTSIAFGLCDSSETVQINAVTGLKSILPGERHFYRINTISPGL